MIRLKNKEAISWMVNHPLKELYDEYGNYFIWGPYSNVIEHHYEIDNENAIWDFDRYSVEEFLKIFEDLELETL